MLFDYAKLKLIAELLPCTCSRKENPFGESVKNESYNECLYILVFFV